MGFRPIFVILDKMKILLVNPPLLVDESRYLPRRPSYPFEHLGLGYLAAFLREKGHQVVIKDAYLSGETAEEFYPQLEKTDPDLIGFSATHGFITSALSLINRFRASGFTGHINLGGYLPTFRAGRLLQDFPQIDSIVRGEGEVALAALAETLEKRQDPASVPNLAWRKGKEIVLNPSGPLITPLDSLPFPARDTLPLLLETQDYASVLTSRGCYGKCNFCSIRSFYAESPGAKWRGRSAENLGEEIAVLVQNYGLTKLAFPDDNFIGPGRKGRERAFSIAKNLLQSGIKISFSVLCRSGDVEAPLFALLKAAGLKTVFVGFESGVNRALNAFGKLSDPEVNLKAASVIKQLGLKCYPGFIMFDPETTLEEIRQNLDFVKKLEGDGELIEIDDLFNSLQPFTGTAVYRELEAQNRLFYRESELLSYDVLPGYRIRDEKVELLREKARGFRHKTASLTYLNFDRLYRELPQKAQEIESRYQKFRALSGKIRRAEEELLKEGVGILEKTAPKAAPAALERLSDSLAGELDPAIKEYNREIANNLLAENHKFIHRR